MGLKKIEAKRQELAKLEKQVNTILQHAQQVSQQCDLFRQKEAKLAQANAKLEQEAEKLRAVIAWAQSEIDPEIAAQFPEIGEYAHYLGYTETDPWHHVRADGLAPLVNRVHGQVEAEFAKWLDKQTAATPREIKPGMVFTSSSTGMIWEITSEATDQPANGRGDEAIVYGCDELSAKGKKRSNAVSKATLSQRDVKFVRT